MESLLYIFGILILSLNVLGIQTPLQHLKILDKFGGLEVSEEQVLGNPVDMSLSKSDQIYVLDSKDNNIKIYLKDGTFIKSIGRKGSGPGEFIRPWKLEIINEKIYVADTGNGRIQVLDEDGKYQRSYKIPVSFGLGMTFDSEGKAYLNTRGFRSPKLISIYDNQGNLIREVGQLEGKSFQASDFSVIKKQIRGGEIPDSFKNELMLIVDAEGNIFAVHQALNKLKKYSADGKLQVESSIKAEEYKNIYKAFLQKNEEVRDAAATYYALLYVNDLELDKEGNLYALLNEPSRMIIYVYSNKGEPKRKLLGVEDNIFRISISNENVLYALSRDTHFIYKFSLDFGQK